MAYGYIVVIVTLRISFWAILHDQCCMQGTFCIGSSAYSSDYSTVYLPWYSYCIARPGCCINILRDMAFSTASANSVELDLG